MRQGHALQHRRDERLEDTLGSLTTHHAQPAPFPWDQPWPGPPEGQLLSI